MPQDLHCTAVSVQSTDIQSKYSGAHMFTLETTGQHLISVKDSKRPR